MALPQEKLREIVFQMLYSFDVGKTEEANLVELMMKELAVTKKSVLEAQEKVQTIAAILQELDDMITAASKSYNFNRIQVVERNILRLGVYELFFDKSIPAKVAISEAVRLARKFGTPESAGFVNAILDALYKVSKGETVDPEAIAKSVRELNESEDRAKKAVEENKAE